MYFPIGEVAFTEPMRVTINKDTPMKLNSSMKSDIDSIETIRTKTAGIVLLIMGKNLRYSIDLSIVKNIKIGSNLVKFPKNTPSAKKAHEIFKNALMMPFAVQTKQFKA